MPQDAAGAAATRFLPASATLTLPLPLNALREAAAKLDIAAKLEIDQRHLCPCILLNSKQNQLTTLPCHTHPPMRPETDLTGCHTPLRIPLFLFSITTDLSRFLTFFSPHHFGGIHST